MPTGMRPYRPIKCERALLFAVMSMPEATPSGPAFRYTPALANEIELKWQDRWANQQTFAALEPAEAAAAGLGQPYFIMDMFPYPSGAGLHVGHPLGYIASDVVGRYRRMQGDNVLHAMGYDAFGLPAEQYAVQTGQHPKVTTEANIATMEQQLRRLGLGHDASRTFATIDPDYVRWTQWIFLQIFDAWYDDAAVWVDAAGRTRRGKARPIAELRAELAAGTRAVPGHEGPNAGGLVWNSLTTAEKDEVINSQRLAYNDESPVNWCPGLGTVLANEEVIDGRSERGNFPVFTKPLSQWKMRITAYGDRLADDLDLIDWPDAIKHMQRNWIGKSTGAHVKFRIKPIFESSGLSVGVSNANQAKTLPSPTLNDGLAELEVFTTRPDTLYGATFMVVAPEHPLLEQLPAEWPEGTDPRWTGGAESPADAVRQYQRQAAGKTAVQRMEDAGKKTGVFTGHLAINPLTGTPIPVFTADYVLMGYGTGAIMAVPGGDQRDFEFATEYHLPIVYTVEPEGGLPLDLDSAYVGDGIVINSPAVIVDATSDGDAGTTETVPSVIDGPPNLNGLRVPEAKAKMIDWLEAAGIGTPATTYRLRDWLFSRQRYWGEPFPIVWDAENRPHALPVADLPVGLPDVPDYQPRTFEPDDATSMPEAPLGRNEDWVNITLDLGDGPKQYRRDTNTMPNWAGSCWYYLRYLDPTRGEADAVIDIPLENYWMGPQHNSTSGPAGGVDLYIGGVEHAVLHLLYARFWHKVLFDLGYVTALEPFGKLFNQGYIQASAYTDKRGAYVPAAEVTKVAEPITVGDKVTNFVYQGEPVFEEYGKMGKSLKNVVTPDEMYRDYGADTFRLYEMSMGPLDVSRPWNTRDVVGSQRFLQRLWRNIVNEETGETTVADVEADLATKRLVNRTIAEVTEEMGNMRPNTAIAKLIQLNNHLTGLHPVPREAIEPLVLMVAPLAPHIAEELWERLGHTASLAREPFPVANPEYLVEDSVTCVLQVKGKVRSRIEVSPSISDDELEKAALADPGLQKAIGDAEIRKVIVRAPNLVNVVI